MVQLVEHCSANAETKGSNPVEVPKFFQVNLQLLKLNLPLRRSYRHLNIIIVHSDRLALLSNQLSYLKSLHSELNQG